MIVVFYGKRNSGKTTLCREFYGYVKQNLPVRCHYLDGDKLRFVYGLKGITEETEKLLIEKAMQIAKYEESLNDLVLMSMSFAYGEQRERFAENKGVLWVYLEHDKDTRNTNKKEYQNYDEPKNVFTINTSEKNIAECLDLAVNCYKEFVTKSQYKK